MVPLSPILDSGKPPSEWVELLSLRGFSITERWLRENANKIGACHRLQRGTIIITPAQIDQILESRKPCPSSRTVEAPRGGSVGASNMSASPSQTTIDEAQAHLEKLARGTGAARRKKGKSGVTY